MCQLKDLIQRVLGIVLLGCLALSLAPNVYAQRKAQSGEALLKEIERATDKGLPKSAIKAGEELVAFGREKRQLHFILKGLEVVDTNTHRIDRKQKTTFFKDLHQLRSLPWLTPLDKVALNLYSLTRHESVRPRYFYNEDIRRLKDSTAFDPTYWSTRQYFKYYQGLMTELRGSASLLAEPLGDYELVFPSVNPVIGVRTFGTALIGATARFEPDRYSEVAYNTLYTDLMSWIRPVAEKASSVYFRSQVDYQLLLQDLRLKRNKLSKQRTEELLYAFANKYIAAPEIGNYVGSLQSLYPRKGTAYASFIEYFLKKGVQLPKKMLKDLAKSHHNALQSDYSLGVPRRVTGRDSVTIGLGGVYLVRRAEVRLFVAPKIQMPNQLEWEPTKDVQPLETRIIDFSLDSLGYAQHEELSFKLPRVGEYHVQVVPTRDPRSSGCRESSEDSFVFTKHVVVEQVDQIKGSQLQWLEAMTGRPLSGVMINGYEDNDEDGDGEEVPDYKFRNRVKTDAFGRMTPDEDVEVYALADGSDPLWIDEGDYYGRDSDESFTFEPKARAEMIWIMPDRPAYRPGQKVHVYGWTAEVGRLVETARVSTGRAVRVELYDANGKEVTRTEVIPNRRGSFAVEFTLPTDRITGRYSVRAYFAAPAKNGLYTAGTEMKSFEVSEYKRRSTELVMTPPKPPYKVGETVRVPGLVRTLSGTGIAGVKVKYTLSANRYVWHPWYNYRGRDNINKTLADSTLTTDEKGQFIIPATLQEIEPMKEEEKYPCYFSWYQYTLRITTTDATGESHSETVFLPVGSGVGSIYVDVPGLINKERGDVSIAFGVYGQEDENEIRQISYTIQQEGRVLYRGNAQPDSIIELRPTLAPLPAGRYELHFSSDYGKGVKFEGKRTFYLYDGAKDKTIPGFMYPLIAQAATDKYSPSQPPRIYWMSALQDGYIFYEVYYDGGSIAEGILRSKSEVINSLTLPLPKDGFTPSTIHVRLYTMNHGALIEQRVSIDRAEPERELTLKWDTFRDRILAGSDEQWSFTLTHKGKRVNDASIAVWMYDAALDQFGRLPLGFDPLTLDELSVDSLSSDRYRPYLHFSPEGMFPIVPWAKLTERDQPSSKFVTPDSTKTPNTSDVDDGEEEEYMLDKSDAKMLAEEASLDAVVVSGYSAPRIAIRGYASAMVAKEASPSVTDRTLNTTQAKLTKPKLKDEKLAPVTMRTNFSESAYFYPYLQTDKTGKVSWSFHTPETLTRWKLIVLAHTSDMKLLEHTETIEAYKDFSVRPNVPRFLREGDSVIISTSVSNGSKVNQKGEFTLELFDVKTKRVVSSRKEPFTLQAGASTDIALPVGGFEGLDSVGLRVVARGKTSSDGEQHLIPVLPSREKVTESLAFTLSKQGRHEIILDSLYPSNGYLPEQGRFDLRVESNPLYLALSALPELGLTKGASALDAATALYAQSVALEVSHAEGFKDWFEARWKALPASERSRLGQDDSLKTQSLVETPWVREAEREGNRERILLEYLQNPMKLVPLSRILKQLSDLQLQDGLWSWYPGMKGSIYTTEAVLRLLLRTPAFPRLERADQLRIEELVRKGFRALEPSIISQYHSILKKKKKGLYKYTYTDLDYLYLTALASERGIYQAEGEAKKARDFFYNELKKTALQLPLSEKAMAAVVFAYGRDVTLAKACIASLREYLKEDKRGMYYANEDFLGYFWCSRTIPTMTATLEALRIVSPEDITTMSEMQRWIINEKRATSWRSSLASSEAIYALSLDLGGKNAPRRTNSSSVIVPLSDGTTFRTEGAYITASLPFTSSVRPSGAMTVTTQSDGEVWGAALAHYTLPTSQIEARGRELKVKRELFVVSKEAGKQVLLPLDEGHELRVGDRLWTRITLILDQDLDFVALHDPRAGFAEPIIQTAGYRWGAGTGYYVEPRDKETNFFFDRLKRGEYTLEYEQYVTRSGRYSGLVTKVQSAYAPEYTAHTAPSAVQLVLPMK